ncbi:MAG: DUF2905 domain-containing protein [Ignavibacterium sp.]|nr:DUF2905 domain-containing protein [Ignavibacterium sp.]MCX7611199.1 DUF2905 domain-containing protein [Ignavibacterium sp.]MDW8376014.1 DUF2905 domain-containing protein [Ignavibacteriales bacterium]
MSNIQKYLIVLGLIVVLIGLFFPFISKIPLFRLPGDIVIEKPNFKFYFPIVSMILISIILSLIFWIIRKF